MTKCHGINTAFSFKLKLYFCTDNDFDGIQLTSDIRAPYL